MFYHEQRPPFNKGRERITGEFVALCLSPWVQKQQVSGGIKRRQKRKRKSQPSCQISLFLHSSKIYLFLPLLLLPWRWRQCPFWVVLPWLLLVECLWTSCWYNLTKLPSTLVRGVNIIKDDCTLQYISWCPIMPQLISSSNPVFGLPRYTFTFQSM